MLIIYLSVHSDDHKKVKDFILKKLYLVLNSDFVFELNGVERALK